MIEGNIIRDPRNQIASDGNGFSVSRSFAAVGDTVSDFEIRNRGMFLRH